MDEYFLSPSAGGAFFIDSSPFRISFLCRTYVGIVRNCSMAIFCSQWPYSPPGSMLLGCLLVLGFSQSQNIIDTSSNSVPLAVALNSY